MPAIIPLSCSLVLRRRKRCCIRRPLTICILFLDVSLFSLYVYKMHTYIISFFAGCILYYIIVMIEIFYVLQCLLFLHKYNIWITLYCLFLHCLTLPNLITCLNLVWFFCDTRRLSVDLFRELGNILYIYVYNYFIVHWIYFSEYRCIKYL